jgi:type VI secretion system ImpC/EvpB family protein
MEHLPGDERANHPQGGSAGAALAEPPPDSELLQPAIAGFAAGNDLAAAARCAQGEQVVVELITWALRARPAPFPRCGRQLAALIVRTIAQIDDLLNRQLNAILHHPRFQQLEAAWRGLRYLTEQLAEGDQIQIRVLNVSWKELSKDLERATEFDQSQLFRKVYSDEFGMPGGQPYGVLLGDYEVYPRPGPGHPTDDIAALRAIATVAAAAFAPFVASAHPSMFGLDSYASFELPLNLAATFQQVEFVKWNSFRAAEDARFVGLVLPRVLMRLPYADDGSRADGFRFFEDVSAPDRRGYLWGSAVYALGSVLIRAFHEHAWLADIRGVRSDDEGGGLVKGLPSAGFSTDRRGVAPRPSTDGVITDALEQELSDLGFIPLCRLKDTPYCAFLSNQSVQKVRQYDQAAATSNARLSAMLQYMLCVSRFAHYIKVIGRDKIGSFATPEECETFLHRWLLNYCIADDKASIYQLAECPLREASVQVRENPRKPGNYQCVIYLKPHFQLDQLATAVKLVTELSPPQASGP